MMYGLGVVIDIEYGVLYEILTVEFVVHEVTEFVTVYLKLYELDPSRFVKVVVGLFGLPRIGPAGPAVCVQTPVSFASNVEFPSSTNEVLPSHIGIAGTP